MRGTQHGIRIAAVLAVLATFGLIIGNNIQGSGRNRLLNVSYDPTRELYQTVNALFVADYEKRTGRHLAIEQSHGGSSRQSRAVISGEEPADVVKATSSPALRAPSPPSDGGEGRGEEAPRHRSTVAKSSADAL